MVQRSTRVSPLVPPLHMDYYPVVIKQHPRTTPKRSPESKYWRRFRNPVFIKDTAPVTSIQFSPSRPYQYAVTSGARIQVFAPKTQKVVKSIARFKDTARSANIRSDGKLVVAGDDSGLVQVIKPTLYNGKLITTLCRSSISTAEPSYEHWTSTSCQPM